MFTKNMLKFLESVSFLAVEHGYFTRVTIDESTRFVAVNFLNKDSQEIGLVAATFDDINKTETPGHLALKLFNQMKERRFVNEHFEKTL